VVTGCWATSDERAASALDGVDAVLTHQHGMADELDRLLSLWRSADAETGSASAAHNFRASESPPGSMDNGWMMKAGTAAGECTNENKAEIAAFVNVIPRRQYSNDARYFSRTGANTLPLLGEHQTGRQRAYLKVQDGCDAHCTYCIIPKLRPALFSKTPEDAVHEARRLVESGHVEIVLTGIFLGAYGHQTALRRRQHHDSPSWGGGRLQVTPPLPAAPTSLAGLVHRLCSDVPGLRRLRLSSLEPGDLTDELIEALRSHPQVVPHFHLPLQSGSDAILRRMNRQYTRGDFLRLVDRVRAAFDRPALTSDIIVGFPGESDADFEQTLEVVRAAGFIHVHAFPYSPRPGTAAARWTRDFVHGPVVKQRMELLRRQAADQSLAFRSAFIGQEVEVIVEADDAPDELRHGRSERYFPVFFESTLAKPGDAVRLLVDRVTLARTFGTVVAPATEEVR
jgi:MiaB/RimO family radical SAM methylthiotransferase